MVIKLVMNIINFSAALLERAPFLKFWIRPWHVLVDLSVFLLIFLSNEHCRSWSLAVTNWPGPGCTCSVAAVVISVGGIGSFGVSLA